MAVKVLVDGLPYDIGGIGSVIMNITSRISKDDFQFSFIINGESEYIGYLDDKSFPYIVVPRFGRYPMAYAKSVDGFLKENDFDVVWINNTSKLNILLPSICHNHGIKVVYHNHGTANEYDNPIKRAIVKILDFIMDPFLMHIIDLGFSCSSDAGKSFYRNMPFTVIANGIDVGRYKYSVGDRDRIRQEYSIAMDAKTVCFCGRFATVKNIFFILDLAADPRLADISFLLIGDGELRNDIEKRIVEDKLHNVILCGKQSDVASYYSASDILLLPSFSEGMPLTLVEAQANGLVCIASCNVTREVAVTDNIHFIDLQDKDKWIESILNMENSDRLSDNAKIKESDFAIDSSIMKFKDKISEIK